MTNEVDSISLSDLFWTQFKKGRISFSFKGLPESIHFTFAWNDGYTKINFHITKNIGDGKDKPKIVIANFDNSLIEYITSFFPTILFNKLYQPISFKKYSRRNRKNIRIFHTDSLEASMLNERIDNIFKQMTTTKKNKIKIEDSFEKHFLSLASSKEERRIILNNISPLTSRSFKHKSIREGVIFIGNKTYPFISANGKCLILKKRFTIFDLLTYFSKPELTKELVIYFKESLEKIQTAKSYSDTIPFNRPYTLFIDKAK